MKKRLLPFITALAFSGSSPSRGASTIIWDRNFAPGAILAVQRILGTPDGKCLVAHLLAEQRATQMLRLNPDGSPDASFTPALLRATATDLVLWPEVTDLALDAQGRVLIAGNFETINNVARPGIARVNDDGKLDATFRAPTNFWHDYGSHRLASLPDGRIIFLNSYHGNESKLVRLNEDGSLDNTFHAAAETSNAQHILVNATGHVITSIGWSLDKARPLARLEPNGGVDATFHRAEFTGQNLEINALTLEPDGKIIVAGQFEAVDGYLRISIARFNGDGTADTSFAPSPGAAIDGRPGRLSVAVGDSKGRVLLGGEFNEVNGQAAPLDPGTARPWGMVRLNSDGTMDPDLFGASPFRQLAPGILSPNLLSPDDHFDGGRLSQVVLQPDGNLLVAGDIYYTEPCHILCFQGLFAHGFVARIYRDFPTNSFEFGAVQFVTTETNSTASITVRRLGDIAGLATVDYTTSDGSATTGQDYQASSGTLTFRPLEVSQSFTVPLLNRGLRERDRMLGLTLTNAIGVQAISSAKARLWIVKPFGIESIARQNGTTRLKVFGSPGSSYVVEYSYFLTDWQDGPLVKLTTAGESISDSTDPHPISAAGATSFYRLRYVAP